MEKLQLEIVTSFLNRLDLSATEEKLKQRVLETDNKRNSAVEEFKLLNDDYTKLQNELAQKQQEVAGLHQQVHALCELVLDLNPENED